jgi:hypothetical protein
MGKRKQWRVTHRYRFAPRCCSPRQRRNKMGAPATSRPGAAKAAPERSGSPFLSGRSWAPIPCSYSAFILRATKLESKVYHLIWSQLDEATE